MFKVLGSDGVKGLPLDDYLLFSQRWSGLSVKEK